MKKLYNALSEQGKYTKSFEDFQTQFGSKEGQEKLYGALERSGDYTKSFEDFSGQFFSGEPAKTNDSASADPAVESNQNSTGSESEDGSSGFLSKAIDMLKTIMPAIDIAGGTVEGIIDSKKAIEDSGSNEAGPADPSKMYSVARGIKENPKGFFGNAIEGIPGAVNTVAKILVDDLIADGRETLLTLGMEGYSYLKEGRSATEEEKEIIAAAAKATNTYMDNALAITAPQLSRKGISKITEKLNEYTTVHDNTISEEILKGGKADWGEIGGRIFAGALTSAPYTLAALNPYTAAALGLSISNDKFVEEYEKNPDKELWKIAGNAATTGGIEMIDSMISRRMFKAKGLLKGKNFKGNAEKALNEMNKGIGRKIMDVVGLGAKESLTEMGQSIATKINDELWLGDSKNISEVYENSKSKIMEDAFEIIDEGIIGGFSGGGIAGIASATRGSATLKARAEFLLMPASERKAQKELSKKIVEKNNQIKLAKEGGNQKKADVLQGLRNDLLKRYQTVAIKNQMVLDNLQGKDLMNYAKNVDKINILKEGKNAQDVKNDINNLVNENQTIFDRVLKENFGENMAFTKAAAAQLNMSEGLQILNSDSAYEQAIANSLGFKTFEEYIDAVYEKRVKQTPNITRGDVKRGLKGSNGVFVGKGGVLINSKQAKKVGAVGVGSHEVLHPILSALVGDAKAQKNIVLGFEKVLSKEQSAWVKGELKKQGKVEGTQEYYNEYITVFSEGLVKNRINFERNSFGKIKDWVTKTFIDKGFDNIDFVSGRGVYNFMKSYSESTKSGKLSRKTTEAIAKREKDKGVKVSEAGTVSNEEQFSKTITEAEAALDAAMDADPDNPSYLDNIDKAEAELDAAEAAAKAPPAVVPEAKKDPKKDIEVFHGGNVKDIKGIDGVVYFSEDKAQANQYAEGNNGEVRSFKLNEADITTEARIFEVIRELGIQPRVKGWTIDDSRLYELIDDRFEQAFTKEDMAKLKVALSEKGIKAARFTDTNLITGKDTENIVVFDKSAINQKAKPKPKVVRPKEPTRTTDLGPRDPLSQKIMNTYDEGMEGVERTEYKASKPLPSRLEGKLVPMFEGYINTIVQQKFKQFANEALEFQDALSILRAEVSNAIRTYNPAKNKDLAGYVKKIIQTRQSLMFKDANAEFAATLDDAKGVTATEDTQSIDRSGTVERGQATFDELDIVDDALIEDIKQDLEKEIRVRVQKGTLSEMIGVKKGRETYMVSWLENYVNKQLFKKLSKKLGAIAGVYPNAVIPGSYIDFLNDPKTFDIITKALPIKSIKKSYSKLFPVEKVGREVTAEGNPVFKISKINKKEFLTYFVKGNKSTVLERQKQLFREILEPLAKQVVADYATPDNLIELKSIQELAPAESMDIIENIVIDAQLSNLESQLDRFKGEEKNFDIIQFSKDISPNAPSVTNELLSIAGLEAKSTLLKDSTKGKQKFYLDRLKEHYKTREEFMDFLPSFITQFRGLTAGLLGFVYREDGSYYDFYRYNYKKAIDEKGETITDKKQLNELFKRGTASFKNKLLDSKGSVSEYSDVTKNLIKEVNKLIKEADLGKLTPNLHSGRITISKVKLKPKVKKEIAQGVLNNLSKNNALNAKIAELYISLLRDFVKASKNKKQAKAAVVNMLLATNNTVNGWRSLASISSIIYNKNKVTDYYFEHNDSMRSVLPNILAQILGKGPIYFKVDSSLIPVDLAKAKNKKQETKVGNKSVADEFYKKEIAKDENLETVTLQFSLTGTTDIEFRNAVRGRQSSYFEVGGVDYTAELFDFYSLKEAAMIDPELMIKEMEKVSGEQKVTTKEYKYLAFDRDGDSEIISAYDAEWNGKRYVYPESDTKQSLAVFGSLINYFLGEIKKGSLKGISFTAAEPSRQRLYNSIVERFSRQIGWNYSVIERPQKKGGHIYFVAKPKNIQFSKSLSKDFNNIIEEATGIKSDKIVSKAKSTILGKKKGRFKFFLPPSAEDFAGLLYKLVGKKEKGNAQQAWFKKQLFDPFAIAMREFESYKQNVTGIVNQLKKEIKNVPGALRKVNTTGFTNEVAVRVYLWVKNGHEIDGLTKEDQKELVDIVEADSDLMAFATQLDTTLNGYPEPQNDWLAGTITTDAINMVNTTKRAEFLQEWQVNADAIFTEDNFNKLRAAFGDNYVEAMKDMLYRMKSGRNRPSGANKLTNTFNNWVNDSVGTIMFFNTRSALLQTLSIVNFINWGDNNPIQAAKAFSNQKQFWSDFTMLFNSDFLKQRRSGLKNDVNADDIANAAETATNKSKAVFASILKMGFLPTQMADSFAIAMGGASFVRNRISKYVSDGMTKSAAEEKAFLDFQEIAEETQQSSRPDRISQQQASPLGRVVLAFANTPMQYMRLSKKAFLDLKNGRGDAKTNITKLIYYTVVQNVIFSALQTALFAAAFGDEDEDAIKSRELKIANSMLDSILRGAGVYGAIASTLKNIVVEGFNQASKDRPDFTVAAQRSLSISPPIDSKMRKLMGAARAFSYKTTRDKMKGFGLDNPAYYATGQLVSAAFNLPLDRVIRKADNLRVAVDNDTKYWQSIALMLGYSQWDLGLIQSEKKKKKSGFGKTTKWTKGKWKK